MESILSAIDYKDPIWIAIAFLFGAISRSLGLPPLVGFLVAGFMLNAFSVTAGLFLNEMADIGVTLLLFTIGLKLNIKNLLKIEIWGSAISHMLIFSLVSLFLLLSLKSLDVPLFNQLTLINALIISFALSFSSTVFVVKSLDDKGEFLSRYGQVAIGILIIQDLVAVVYLGVSAAKAPSLWAIALIIVAFLARPLIIKLSKTIGHGELLLLFGLTMALGGAALFEAVDMKADLGALVFGVLLANTSKADELSSALLSIKELFLLGFFLSIGMAGLPSLVTIMVVVILLLFLFIKGALFFFLLAKFKEHIHLSTQTSLALSNYSEFGLIVTIVGVSQGWISNEWLIVMAVLISVSFIISSTISKKSEYWYEKYKNKLKKYQHPKLSAKKSAINCLDATILICGMGRVGSGAYDQLRSSSKIISIDFNPKVVINQLKQGRKTKYGIANDTDFWSQIDIKNTKIQWILLCSPNVLVNQASAKLARKWGFKGSISAICVHDDEVEMLTNSGADSVFNIYSEAGAGLALHCKI